MYQRIIGPLILTLISFTASAGGTSGKGFEEEINVYRQVYNSPLCTNLEESTTMRKLAKNRPMIVGLVFSRCSGICSPFIMKLKEELQYNLQTADDYQVVVISFDPRDSRADMENYAAGFQLDQDPKWHFGITRDIDSLTASFGFHPVWDETTRQFDHEALLVGVNREGFITKRLLGIRQARDLENLIASINNKYAPSYRLPGQSKLFSCFNYDPATGNITPGTGLLFVAAPLVLAILVLIFIQFMAAKGRKAERNVPIRHPA